MKRVTAPQHPAAARRAELANAARAARERPAGARRTPAELDAALDLLLELHAADLEV